jgi:hypothetical protein
MTTEITLATETLELTLTPVAAPDLVIDLGQAGPPGPPGPPGPAGVGDMQTLIYDPQGAAANCFNLANMSGNLDGGTFS